MGLLADLGPQAEASLVKGPPTLVDDLGLDRDPLVEEVVAVVAVGGPLPGDVEEDAGELDSLGVELIIFTLTSIRLATEDGGR